MAFELFKLTEDVTSYVRAPYLFRSFADKVVLWSCIREPFQAEVGWWPSEVLKWNQHHPFLSFGNSGCSQGTWILYQQDIMGKQKKAVTSMWTMQLYHFQLRSSCSVEWCPVPCHPPAIFSLHNNRFSALLHWFDLSSVFIQMFCNLVCWLWTTSCNIKGVILILIALHLPLGKDWVVFK